MLTLNSVCSLFTLLSFLILAVLIWDSWRYRMELKQAEKEGKAKPVWFTRKVAVLLILSFIFHLLGTFCRARLFDLEVSRILQR